MTASGNALQKPVLAASIAVWNGDKVLLVQRGKPPLTGIWSLPGGHVELGEKTADAALRELGEETGIIADIVGLVDVVDVIGRDDSGALTHHYVLAAYAGRYRSGTAIAGDDAADARWVLMRDIASYTLTSGTDTVIHCSFEIASRGRDTD